MRAKLFFENLNKYWATPMIAIIGGILGIYFTIIKDSLEADAQRIENVALKIESELKQQEFKNNLKIQMYGEVKDAITQNDEKLQNAVLLLVNEMLADDSLFREQLITILLTSPNVNESVRKNQEEIQTKAEVFIKEEKQISATNFFIDVFYLEDIISEAKPRAEIIVRKLTEELGNNYQVRLRRLPLNINAKSGYRISANEIRYEKDEAEIAEEVLELIQSENVFSIEQPRMKQIRPSKKTPNYLSIFVRNM
ncbi:hypothetical protein [Carboxylicivirga sp. N1Y90]|uniref:hypothetical protein n=1 Tax=Carboxylicivirga fragile TaxID=3417571 RepID=UPI003D333ACF|nr:hypothetical protein [Marinilabiliaceae bacterium N1Y90]